MTDIDLSIIIVSWNVRDFLIHCIESIHKTTSCKYEIHVVDNCSSDDSANTVAEKFPQIHLIRSSENLGFARANNLAIPQCAGRIILLLNPDTIVHEGALDKLVTFLDEHPLAGAAGSRLLNPDGSLQPSCFPFPTPKKELWRLLYLDKLHRMGTYDQSAWDIQTPRPVEVLQGTSLALRRTALDQTGFLDENFFMYTEEVDLCFRLHQKGWELWYVPESQVTHYGGQSTQQASRIMFLNLYESKLKYLRKHHGERAARQYKWILTAAAITRLAYYPMAWFEPPTRRSNHLALAGNYLSLLKAIPGY